MHKYYLSKSLFILFFIIHICVDANIIYASQQDWIELETGLKYTELQNPDNIYELIHILSFDPEFFKFNLYNVSENKHKALTLKQWAKQENLIAAINASMYLPDQVTSTGYMRNNEHINNKRIAKSFGAFLVSKPYPEHGLSLAAADILDKDKDNWKELIAKYEVVVQNFRLINAEKEILWKDTDSPFSISAIGEDNNGNILLLHISYAITPYRFAKLLLDSSLNLSTVMYTEGGHQAGLFIDVPKFTEYWNGSSVVDFLMPGKVSAVLPNIIGITRK